MFDIGQFRIEIVKPACENLNSWSEAAEELLVLTCAVETDGGSFVKQVGGEALGIFQMEPATHDDIWSSYLPRNTRLAYWTLQASRLHCKPDAEVMKYNLMYATLMARIYYLRFKEPIPDAKDTKGLAEYWKRLFNSNEGAGTVEGAIKKYHLFTGKQANTKSKSK